MARQHIQGLSKGIQLFLVVGQQDGMDDHAHVVVALVVGIVGARGGRAAGRGGQRGQGGGGRADGSRLGVDAVAVEGVGVLRGHLLDFVGDLPQRPDETEGEAEGEDVDEDVVGGEDGLGPVEGGDVGVAIGTKTVGAGEGGASGGGGEGQADGGGVGQGDEDEGEEEDDAKAGDAS